MPAQRIDLVRLREVADGTRTLAEVAALCGVAPVTASRWVRRLDLPRCPVGKPVAGRRGDQCRICGTRLDTDTDTLGRLLVRCVGCERRKARRCMDCNRPVSNTRAWRCESCRDRRQKEQYRQYRERNLDMLCEREKRRQRTHTPEQRAHRLAVKKAWRERNRLKITLIYRRKQRLAGRGGFATREQYLAYHKAYNAARAAEKREYMRQRAIYAHASPTCRVCGAAVPWLGTGRPPLDCPAHTRNPKVRERVPTSGVAA